MRFLKNKTLLIGLILWPITIAIPQFNLNYTTGILNGKLNYGEIPPEFFLGLISGLFAALFFWVIGIMVSKVVAKVRKKEIRGSTIYFYITLFFFALMLITQSNSFYRALTLDKDKVNEARELIKEYEGNAYKNR